MMVCQFAVLFTFCRFIKRAFSRSVSDSKASRTQLPSAFGSEGGNRSPVLPFWTQGRFAGISDTTGKQPQAIASVSAVLVPSESEGLTYTLARLNHIANSVAEIQPNHVR